MALVSIVYNDCNAALSNTRQFKAFVVKGLSCRQTDRQTLICKTSFKETQYWRLAETYILLYTRISQFFVSSSLLVANQFLFAELLYVISIGVSRSDDL